MIIFLIFFNRIPHNKAWSTLEYADPHTIPVDPPTNLENCQRKGLMAIFDDFAEFENHFDDLMDYFSPTLKNLIENELSPRENLCGTSLSLGSSLSEMILGEQKVSKTKV